MSKKIIFSDGGKGGVGKSFVSICLIDYLIALGHHPVVVESDTVNPDVGRIFKNNASCTSLFFNLNSEEKWMKFTLKIEDFGEDLETVVVNLPAGEIDPNLAQNALSLFRDLGFSVTTAFTINRHEDSLNLLRNSINNGLLRFSDECLVVKNGTYGAEDSFSRFDLSEAKKQILDREGQIVYIPELFHLSCDLCLVEKKMTFSDVIKESIQLTYRYQISRWINDVHCRLDTALANGVHIEDFHVVRDPKRQKTVNDQ